MNPHNKRQQQRDPQRHTTRAASPAADNLSRPTGGRTLPPRPMREILGDDEDLPTLAGTHIDPLYRPSRAEPSDSAGLPAPGNSQGRAPLRDAGHPVQSSQVRYAQQHRLSSHELEDNLLDPAFERPVLRPLPVPLLPRTPLMLLVVALLSTMILLSALGSGGQSVLTRFVGGGAAANSIAAAGGSGSLAGARPPGDYELKAPPSISAQHIDRILAEYGSPATGTGQIWYELGRRYGIDPAFAVAFFIHESGAGTSPAWAGLKPDGSTTHNVGNIICAGYSRCYGRFRDYGSWQEGIEDWYRLIDVEYLQGRGHRTVADIIPVYAPSIENDVQNYINVVHRLVDEWRSREVR